MDKPRQRMTAVAVVNRPGAVGIVIEFDAARWDVLKTIATLPDCDFAGVTAAMRAFCDAAIDDASERRRQTRRLLRTAKAELKK